MTDQALWHRWHKHGDATAFKEIADRYGSLVYATCRRILNNRTDAEDVAQECFEFLARRQHGAIDRLGPFLHTLATRRAIDKVRAEQRRKHRETRYAAERPDTEIAQHDDFYAHVDEAIAALPDALRQPIVLHFLEGQTHQEIADKLGIARTTATHRIQKGIETIRKRLRKRNVILTTAALEALCGKLLTAEAQSPALVAACAKLALGASSVQPAATTALLSSILGGTLLMKKALLATTLALAALIALWTLYPVSKPNQPTPPATEFANTDAEPVTVQATRTLEPTTQPEVRDVSPPTTPIESPQPEQPPQPIATKDTTEGVLTTLKAYLDGAYADDLDLVRSVFAPDKAATADIDSIKQLHSPNSDVIFDIYADTNTALAISESLDIPDEKGDPQDIAWGAYLVFTLIKSESGTWLIDDIDLEGEEGANGEVQRFTATHPNMHLLTAR